jgi:hypothetical protein
MGWPKLCDLLVGPKVVLVLLESRLVAGWLRTYRVHDEDYLCPVERLIQKCKNYDIIKENK